MTIDGVSDWAQTIAELVSARKELEEFGTLKRVKCDCPPGDTEQYEAVVESHDGELLTVRWTWTRKEADVIGWELTEGDGS